MSDRITRADVDRIAATVSENMRGEVKAQRRNGYLAIDHYVDDYCVSLLHIGTKREVYTYLQGMRRAHLLRSATS